MEQLLKDFRSIDVTNLYAREKIMDPDYIGSKRTRLIVRVLRTLGLTGLALALANRMSVLVFVCDKKVEKS
jgi:hypothetical protein